MEIIITRLELSWEEAVDYVRSRSGYLPTLEMCEEMKFSDNAWTANTYENNEAMAYSTTTRSGEWVPRFKKDKQLVIICPDQWTNQILSFREGDIKTLENNLRQPHSPSKVDLTYISSKITEEDYMEIQRKYTPRVYNQRMLAEEYHIPVAQVNTICQAIEPYICSQCGLDKNGSEVHTETNHVFPGCTVKEAVKRLWPDYDQYENQ